ncbi:class I adenylate-forming enzyme family protein [Niveispirillum sp.]|uniref:class I adenylate-forming enzyme family protein n=1 Tax=Niveispirillum sp. TaxID=1917217 RepID=UPI001B68DADD|nr:AMP-binding protein [Niveispirillum sp.]MBP7339240.1 AMP-binding protein [Niveispirillum sp.]
MRELISHLPVQAAARFGGTPALTLAGGLTLDFATIEERVARCAGGLAARGLGRGERVVLHLPNGWEWIVAYYAIARLGAVVVPANILLSPSEVAFLATDAQAFAVIAPAERLAAVRAAAADLPFLSIPLEGPGEDGFRALLSAPPLPPVELAPDDLFTIGYTSGTTGRPKGAMLSHRNIFASTAMTATIHVRRRGESVLTALPFPHVYGNIVLNAAFLVGMRLVVMERFDPGAALRLIGAERITLFEGVPTMYYQMLADPGLAAADLSSLERCTVGGQTMPTASIEEVESRFGCPLLELWGMTEVAGPAISHSPYWPAHHGSIGLPFPGMEVRIADLEQPDREAAAGTAGELRVRGPLVTRGYWRNPAATADLLDADGWLATGDVAVRDAGGYLRIVDRRKDMIITAGYNVYPAELEQVLARHPAIAMVAVASVPDAQKGELAKAYIVLRPGAQADAAAIEAHCRFYLAAYKVPRLYAFVTDLPKTSTGKILRRALREAPPTTHA